MAIRGYTSVERVEHHTGRTFTDGQRAECSLLLPVAEAWIDGYCRRTWGTTTPLTGEVHRLSAPTWPAGTGAVDVVYDLSWYPPLSVRLTVRPVASVSAVSVRTSAPGSVPQPLVAGTQYELLDPDTGLLSVASGYAGWLVLVDYTPAVPVDPRVELAATKLVAAWMRPALEGVNASTTGGATSYQVGDVRVSYGQPQAGSVAATATSGVLGIPDEALAPLAGLRRMVFA